MTAPDLDWSEIYVAHVDEIYRYLLRRLGDRTLAEDLTSATFLRAIGGNYRDTGSSVTAWLITIAQHLLADHFRSGRFRCERLWSVGTANGRLHDPDSFNTWENYLDRTVNFTPGHEDAVCDAVTIWPLVAAMSPHWAEYITLRYLMEYTTEEVAERMGRSNMAVRAIGHRVRSTLREKLAVAA